MSKATQPASCPDPEDLGAYVEATLDERTMSEITAHIAGCNDCLDVVTSTIRFRREEGLDHPAALRWWSRPAIWLAAAAAFAGIVGLATFRDLLSSGSASALGPLAAAAPHDYRVVEPRLTGFRWAAMLRYREGGANSLSAADPEYLKLAGAAGVVLEHAKSDTSADAAHAAGVAKLLLRDATGAVGWLDTASRRSPTDAHVWSDLAGARLTRAVQEKRPGDLPLALEDADRALKLDPRLSDARFNRALVLEKLGLRAEAATAWRAYLEVDPDSGWAEEARQHLQRLGPSPAPSAFRDRVDSIERAAVANDAASVVRLVDPYRQDARAWFEADLGVWGKAFLDGNAELATRKLSAARQVGAALLSLNGESLLHDAVRAIDSAPNDRTALLARAHLRYREGRLAYRDHHLAEAEKILADAATRFEALGSPMAGVAQYYVANTIFEQNRLLEAQTMLERLLAGDRLAQVHHLALDAQVRAQLGLCYGYGGRWREDIDEFNRSSNTFSALGEFGFVASTEMNLAESYDLLAQPTLAWQHRLAAFDLLSAHPFADRLIVAISGGVRAETHQGHPQAALSLLTLELAEARRMQKEILIADALRRRGLILAATGDESSAWRDLREARALASRTEPGLRDRLEAENHAAEAVLTRRADPQRAITLLTASIEFFRKARENFNLPDALLERARSERAVHAADAAHRDLEDGIRELESQRAAAAGAELRATIFDEGAGLFEEAVDSFVAEGDGERAFAYAERGRARTLLETRDGDTSLTVATSTAALSQALAPGAVLVEFMLVRDSVIEFALFRSGLQVVRPRFARAEIEIHVRAFRTAIEQRRDITSVRAEGAWLDAALLAPIRSVLGRKPQSMIMVPDRFLEAVPWAALCDGVHGPWLIEQSDVTVAPSAAIWLRDTRRSGGARSSPRLLVVSSSGGRTTEMLEQSDHEARAIASLYREAGVLTGAEATADRFVRDSPRYDVVHFCGHAQPDVGGASLLFATTGDAGSGRLSAHDISVRHLDRTRLVVLAACGTASGDDERLDGVPTLARAFLTAGAPSVVASLWPIDDEEAAALTLELHRALRQSGDPAAALREAQRFMLSSAKVRWRDPAAWAGIELLGSSIHL
jgi:CHAT domain-containing protein